ncbi:glucose-6-phosphate 1-epimerase [Prosthecobacter fusiformis]|uniref:Putative glucose-6-phosphate 1-epimerase n=1 Tax=Prosthecobacter fusiformis TaxID=48464 RepID=A0A4R7STI9_9BACT|nr:D-hexose-6-phosphate mutarotase [Prosthecobacter fusiformis]TDU81568.1 glucose-6-phosphate 1-epimerase [Prosthecobacter fusiformis]
MSLPASIILSEAIPDYPVFVIQHPACTARIALHGAHVMEWAPSGHSPVLYLSPQALLEPGKPIRGGIPVCWPWFGPHPSDESKPMHGFARTRPWKLMEASESEEGVKMSFVLCSDPSTHELWPHEFEAHVTVILGAKLDVSLQTINKSGTELLVADALHTYLTVGDIGQVTVKGLADAEYLDTVGERTMRHQTGDITFDREVDRQYVSTGTVKVEDPALGRTLSIEKAGSQTTVVWNPWIEKSKRLGDLPDEAYLQFLCVEAANAGEAVVRIAPGAANTLQTVISL